jgi:uncharacterized membrane protein
VRTTVLRHLGTALLVIVVVAVAANLGVVPTFSPEVAIYEGIFDVGVNVGIFWILLQVSLVDLRRAGGKMILLFAIGALGTIVGVTTGLFVIDAAEVIGERWPAFGGMFVATYTGGSANLNILAAEYGVARDGALYIGANAVDAIMTTVWMVATIVLPRLLWRVFPRARAEGDEVLDEEVLARALDDTERLHPVHLALLVALGAGAYFASTWSTAEINAALEAAGSRVTIPRALVITTLALALAQVPAIARLAGARTLGMFALYLFLAVIGALCDLSALEQLGSQAASLFLFVTVAIALHGLVCFGLAGVLRLDWDMAAVASQANVGGGTTALALARGLGRADLVLPGILVGSLGTASGTYLGILTTEFLLGGG